MLVPATQRQFENTLTVYVSRDLPEMARKQMAAAARQTVARVETEQTARSGGIKPRYTAIVDGVAGGSFDSVRPDGIIVLDWDYMQEAVTRTVAYLRAHGPKTKGQWKASVVAEVDGSVVDADAPIPRGARAIYIGADTPYSRRLEIGKRKGGGPFVIQVQQHFVEAAALLLKKTLKDVAVVKFTYASFRGLHTRMSRKELRDSRVPSIAIYPANVA